MQIANYQGVSQESYAIRFLTHGDWSHTAFLVDQAAADAIARLRARGHPLTKLEHANVGAVIEAWNDGCRNVASISDQHTPGTVVGIFSLKVPLTPEQEERLILAVEQDIGTPYDWTDIGKYLLREDGREGPPWFCSKWVFQSFREVGCALFERVKSYQVVPNMIPTSPMLSDPVMTKA